MISRKWPHQRFGRYKNQCVAGYGTGPVRMDYIFHWHADNFHGMSHFNPAPIVRQMAEAWCSKPIDFLSELTSDWYTLFSVRLKCEKEYEKHGAAATHARQEEDQ